MYNRTLINKSREEPYESGADSFKLVIPKGVKTHLLLIHLKGFQNGGTQQVLSDILAQIAGTITISIGNTVVLKLTPSEYMQYLIRKIGVIGMGSAVEGTGADNDVFHFTLPLVLCPLDKDAIKYGGYPLLQKGYGFDGGKEISVLIEYPADANEIDTRVLTVYSIGIPNDSPSKVVEWKSTTTPALTVAEDQKLGISQNPAKMLFELFLKQASYLVEGDNTDVRTIETIAYLEGNEPKHFPETRLEDFARPFYEADGLDTADARYTDQYQILEFHDSDDADSSITLKDNSQLSVEVGVAEAITYVQRLITPLSVVS